MSALADPPGSLRDLRDDKFPQDQQLDVSEIDLSILRLVAEGYQIDTVANRLHLSGRTVRRRTRALCDRFGARAPIQIAVWAARRGLI